MASSTLVAAVVDDLDDPEGLGRVRVRFPHLDQELSNWARLVSAGAGHNRGNFFRPERGDEVIVAFEHDDPRRPYVLGGVWSVPAPPPSDKEKAVDNNRRQIVTRSGHMVRFDDGKGAERVEIIASGGNQKVVLDVAGGRIEVTAGKGDVVVDAAGKVTIKSSGDLTVSAGGNLEIKATGKLKLSGSTVDIN